MFPLLVEMEEEEGETSGAEREREREPLHRAEAPNAAREILFLLPVPDRERERERERDLPLPVAASLSLSLPDEQVDSGQERVVGRSGRTHKARRKAPDLPCKKGRRHWRILSICQSQFVSRPSPLI